jgi:hypothetical protein
MKSKLWALAVIFLFVSCATAPKPREIINSFPIEKPYDAVWQAVVETFAELQLPIMNMEKDSGLIVTDWIDFTGQKNTDYCDCGGLGINIEVNRVGKFNVFVKKVTDNSCEAKINTMYQQTIKFSDVISKRKCVSTGNLEAQFYKLVNDKLK